MVLLYTKAKLAVHFYFIAVVVVKDRVVSVHRLACRIYYSAAEGFRFTLIIVLSTAKP